MDKEILSGKWDEISGKLKQQWGKLTDDDLTEIKGDKQRLYGKLKQHYGYSKEEVERQLERFQKH